ncbi:TPA: hypothetical protein PAP86_004369 [Salmonella enterica]|nr:hypothetical protein [Salmonella enterica subsp. enterica serovar Poona]EHI7918895.1 hypothetical protein [Salmonella enterica]EHI9911025.1 hypothetical protein [Salmonella enterica]EHJ0911558.1 hypothetical protein [Salmonella enterica]HAF5680781.1 hypothetical protein [Salmonella enterica]
MDGQKALFVPDFDSAIAVIQQNTGIGYIPHHMVKALLNNGTLVKKAMQEHKHATRLFIATRSDGLGESVRWSIEYLQRSEMKLALNGG